MFNDIKGKGSPLEIKRGVRLRTGRLTRKLARVPRDQSLLSKFTGQSLPAGEAGLRHAKGVPLVQSSRSCLPRRLQDLKGGARPKYAFNDILKVVENKNLVYHECCGDESIHWADLGHIEVGHRTTYSGLELRAIISKQAPVCQVFIKGKSYVLSPIAYLPAGRQAIGQA